MPSSRLQETEHAHHTKPIPTTPHFRPYHRLRRWNMVHKVRHTLGLQQCVDQKGRRTQDSVQNKEGTLSIPCHAVWPPQRASNISSNDERDVPTHHCQTRATGDDHSRLYGRHWDSDEDNGGRPHCRGHRCLAIGSRQRPVFQTKQVHLSLPATRLPGGNP